MKEALLFTAGIDSFIARKYLLDHGRKFDNLYFNHKGKYCNVELEYIKRLDIYVDVIENMNFSSIEQPSAFIPNRNVLMTIMANSLGYDMIWIGGSKSDRVCDNNEKVFSNLSEFLSRMNGKHISIDSPFWDCYKEDMIRWYITTSVDQIQAKKELLMNTFSCFTPLPDYQNQEVFINGNKTKNITRECWNCNACFRKNAVLYSCGIECNFFNPSIVDKYELEFSNPLISTPRTRNTMDYINWWKSRNQKS